MAVFSSRFLLCSGLVLVDLSIHLRFVLLRAFVSTVASEPRSNSWLRTPSRTSYANNFPASPSPCTAVLALLLFSGIITVLDGPRLIRLARHQGLGALEPRTLEGGESFLPPFFNMDRTPNGVQEQCIPAQRVAFDFDNPPLDVDAGPPIPQSCFSVSQYVFFCRCGPGVAGIRFH